MADTRIIAYARVSTEDQDMALQIAAFERWRHPISGRPVDHIVQEHGSGGKMDRPGWRRVMKARRQGDTVLVWKLDRLGRTLSGVLEAVDDMAREGVEFISLSGEVNTTTAMGRAFFQIAAVFAELERGLISERTKAGMEVARAMGKQFGPKHFIRDYQKRLDAFRTYVEDGSALTMRPVEAVAILNKADPKAPKITSLETYRRWRREGFEGID